MKYIRKVVHHLPSGKEWFSTRTEMTPDGDTEHRQWMSDIICDKTVAFSMVTGNGTTDYTKVGFSQNILKDCVIRLEVYDERDE